MEKLTRAKLKIIRAALGLFLASGVAVLSVVYAWFLSGNKNNTSPIEIGTQGDRSMQFFPTVTAVRNYLTGAKLKNTYVRDEKLDLKLASSDFTQDGGGQTQKPEKEEDFLFREMLPGESVDITFGVYLQTNELVGQEYEIRLCDFGMGENNYFTLQGDTVNTTTKYSVAGAYQWGVLRGETANMAWMNDYLAEPYQLPTAITIYSGTWTEENVGADKAVWVTLRIQENFSNYYAFLGKSGAVFTNYLSNKILSVGRILLIGK